MSTPAPPRPPEPLRKKRNTKGKTKSIGKMHNLFNNFSCHTTKPPPTLSGPLELFLPTNKAFSLYFYYANLFVVVALIITTIDLLTQVQYAEYLPLRTET